MNNDKSGTDYSVTTLGTVVVEKTKLLATLVANREKHDSIYAASVAGYWIEAQKVLEQKKLEFDDAITKVNAEFAKQSTQFESSFTHQLTGMQFYVDEKNQSKMPNYFSLGGQISVHVPFNNGLSLVAPESHVEDYSRVIDLLTYTVADKVELSIKDFEAYVRNNWTWRQSFLGTNAVYANNLVMLSGCVGTFTSCSGMASVGHTYTTGYIGGSIFTGGSVHSMTNQLGSYF